MAAPVPLVNASEVATTDFVAAKAAVVTVAVSVRPGVNVGPASVPA